MALALRSRMIFLKQLCRAQRPKAIKAAIKDLLDWAILIRQPRLGGYALFAGSDFDLDEAIGRAVAPVDHSSSRAFRSGSVSALRLPSGIIS